MMNQFEKEFKLLIEADVPELNGVICYNFNKSGDGKQFECLDDNGLFILHTKTKYSYLKIRYNISSNNPETRLKMYYATSPKDEFCEENSRVLGFFNGDDYEEIVDLDGISADSFRFDFGFDPIIFKINNFELSELSTDEISELKKDIRRRKSKVLKYNLKRFPDVIRYCRKHGIKASIERAKYAIKNENAGENAPLSTQQVIEPYKVEIKKPLENNRKKVLHFIENFYTGGSSRLIIDIIEHYGHKYDNKIFTMAYHGEEEFLNVDVDVINVENSDEVLRKIADYNPDIIHVHIWKGEWYHKVFDILDNVSEKTIIENINTPIAPIVRDYIKKFVFVSQYVVDEFYSVNDPRTEVIYPGSNFDMFTRPLDDGYLAKDTIGMVYRLGYDKLNSKSIEVFIKTVQKRPNTKAIIVGGGPQYDCYVDKVKKAGVFDNFVFTGYVPYVDLPKWYEQFTIFVAPVWQESFGQVSPFAMSMGMPVSGYNIGALNEIIDNPNLLAAPEDSDALSDILVELLNDYNRCVEIGRSNQKRAHALFGVQKMVDDYFELYEELTSK